MENKILEDVKEYYGKTLKSSNDLQTNACCIPGTGFPKHQTKVLKDIHPEILDKFYGCGSPIPLKIEGKTLLDLGCGTGRDCYLASALVGKEGKVIGIDMTDEQLEVANKHKEYHKEKFGYSNVEFKKGFIEDLAGSGIGDGTIDVLISNCVINLSPNKELVFKEIHRVLREGGELYFSDIYCDRRIPQNLRENKELWGECLSGSLYLEDFRRLMLKYGFSDIRVVSKSSVTVENKEIEKLLGNIKFYSITFRIFKISSLEDKCEDFGQKAIYKGGIEGAEEGFVLDDHHLFKVGESYDVCGNTADMLTKTRFGPYFEVTERGEHRGLFDCSGDTTDTNNSCSGGSCC